MEFLTGEPLPIDLLNTRAQTADGEVDALDSAARFRAWLAEQGGRVRWPLAESTHEQRLAVRAFREHVRAAVEAARNGEPPAREDLEAINDAAQAAPSYVALALERGEAAAVRRREGEPLARFLAEVAEASVELITDPQVRKIRRCEGPQCRMLFLPAHPRRRWCSPALCGNRVRVARYYERHKRPT